MTLGLEAAQRAFEACGRGEPTVGFGEIYVQTGYDPTPAPEGYHLLSVFGQYAPYELSEGDWDSRRDEVARQFIDLIDRFAPGFREILVALRGARPARHRGAHRPDRRQHLPGRGHPGPDVGAPPVARAPRSTGFYFCGAATHPAGSVIALNGRNAAQAVLADAQA